MFIGVRTHTATSTLSATGMGLCHWPLSHLRTQGGYVERGRSWCQIEQDLKPILLLTCDLGILKSHYFRASLSIKNGNPNPRVTRYYDRVQEVLATWAFAINSSYCCYPRHHHFWCFSLLGCIRKKNVFPLLHLRYVQNTPNVVFPHQAILCDTSWVSSTLTHSDTVHSEIISHRFRVQS